MDALLRREGDVWAIQLDGRTARVRDSRGMQHLAVLLTRPGAEVHSLELAGAPEAVTSGAASPLLDQAARAAYKERLSDLASDLDEADRFNDPERSARIQAEIDALVDQLTSSTGLGGKDRGTVTDAERARVAVRRAVKSALDRITEAHPALGAHLAATVRTGFFCSYVPDPASPVRWIVGDADPEPVARRRPERQLVVGRETEQAALRDALRTGGVVLVSGEPGIGKTTLVRDLEAEADLALHGRCDDHLGVPYQPLVEAVRTLVAVDGAAVVARDAGVGALVLARVVPELGASSAAVDQPDTERLLLFEAFARVLVAAASRRPVVLSVEDIHWAPQPTLALLLHVLRALEGARALAVLTYRDTELSDDLTGFLASVSRLPAVSRISLAGIDVDAVVALGASADEAKRLVEHTNGNPYFVCSLLGTPSDSPLPASVLDVVAGRVARLTDDARRLITLTAVAGHRVPMHLVTVLATSIDAIEEVLAAGLLGEDGATICFPHALVRRAITQRTFAVRRAALHGEVALAMEQVGAPAAELAFHFAEAGAAAPATRHAIAAAEEAIRAFAFEEAVAHAERGLTFAIDGTREAAQLLLVLGLARSTLGDVTAATAVLDDAAALATAIEDWELLADVAITRGSVGGQVGVYDEGLVAILWEACTRLGDTDLRRRAQLLARIAIEESGGGRVVDARRRALESVTLARDSLDAGVLVRAVRAQWMVSDAPEQLEDRMALALELDALVDTSSGLDLQISAKGAVIATAAETGDVDLMDDALAELHLLCTASQVPRFEWFDLEMRVLRAVIAGDIDEAEQLSERELSAGMSAGVPNALRGYALQLLIIRDEQGRAGEIADLAVQMAIDDVGTPATPVMAAFACVRAGRDDDARALLGPVALRDLPRDSVWLGALCGAAQVALALDDRELASTVDELLRPFAGRNCVIALGTISIGPVDRYLSFTARTLGDGARAEQHLADAIALDERMRARRWLERDRADLASLLGSPVN